MNDQVLFPHPADIRQAALSTALLSLSFTPLVLKVSSIFLNIHGTHKPVRLSSFQIHSQSVLPWLCLLKRHAPLNPPEAQLPATSHCLATRSLAHSTRGMSGTWYSAFSSATSPAPNTPSHDDSPCLQICSYLHLLEPLPQVCFLVWGQVQFVYNVCKEIILETYLPWEIFIDHRPVGPQLLH